jgi:phage tail-like protein
MSRLNSLLLLAPLLLTTPLLQRDGLAGGTDKGGGASSDKGLLELDGKTIGFIQSMEGGSATAEVIVEKTGATPQAKKRLGRLKYEDISLRLGFPLDKTLAAWLADTCKGKVARKNGAVAALDFALNERARLEFQNALLTEIGFPALDASSKDPAYLTLKLQPAQTRYLIGVKNPGKIAGDKPGPKWLASHFRLEIAGLDCSHVTHIDPIAIHLTGPGAAAGQLDFSNLHLTLTETSAKSWLDWHEDFVIRGKNDASKEKNGALVFLAPNLKQELGRLTLHNLGIFKLTPPRIGGTEAVRTVTAELYCQRMEFSGAEAPK